MAGEVGMPDNGPRWHVDEHEWHAFHHNGLAAVSRRQVKGSELARRGPGLFELALVVALGIGCYKGFVALDHYLHDPKEFHVQVKGSPDVPFVLEVYGAGSTEKRIYKGSIPRDYIFPAKGVEAITVNASRPQGVAFGVIELTLTDKTGKLIDRAETKPPHNLAQVRGS